MGFGKEITHGKFNTPGKPLHQDPRIVKDKCGFKILEMPRNHPRVV